MSDAADAAALLGSRMETVSIEPAMQAYQSMLAPLFDAFNRSSEDVTEENIQARSRGMTLMAISNKLGLMLLTTGNKSEMSVGYATLYGDMCGGYSVLKDVYKTTAFDLCRWRNASSEPVGYGPPGVIIPPRIIDKPPTAELKEGQTDEASLGPYRHLDAVLVRLTEGMMGSNKAAEEASVELGEFISPEYAYKIARLVRGAQYKRRQAPPGVVVSERDFGVDYRFPIAGKYGL
jgi:NAD+ synthase